MEIEDRIFNAVLLANVIGAKVVGLSNLSWIETLSMIGFYTLFAKYLNKKAQKLEASAESSEADNIEVDNN